jgi:hypothetical protein
LIESANEHPSSVSSWTGRVYLLVTGLVADYGRYAPP